MIFGRTDAGYASITGLAQSILMLQIAVLLQPASRQSCNRVNWTLSNESIFYLIYSAFLMKKQIQNPYLKLKLIIVSWCALAGLLFAYNLDSLADLIWFWPPISFLPFYS
jgi:peptidoglycan/LPS O-acetylase OafA/YrhL